MGASLLKEETTPMAIDYAKKYQTYIDEELAANSATEWMAAGEGQVRFGEGNKVEINTLTTTGLGNYDKTKTDGTAYPSGAVTSTWTSRTLTMDRGVKFALDHSAPEDISFPATVENVIREFAKTQLAKEQDFYRIFRLYDIIQGSLMLSGTHVLTYDSANDDIVDKLCTIAQTIETDSDRTGGLVAMIASNQKNAFLRAAADNFNKITFEQQVEINGITYSHVMMVNDLPCIFVPASRMKTVMSVQNGRDGESAGGNVADYVAWAQELEGVAAASAVALGRGAGTVDVYYSPTEDAPANLKQMLKAHLEKLRPVGADVQVIQAQPVSISVAAQVSRAGDIPVEDIGAAFTEAMEHYLAQSKLAGGGQIVSINRIISLLMGCSGVADLSGVTLNGGTVNLVMEQGTYAVVGSVTLTEADHV